MPAQYLAGGVGLPEGAAGDFRELHVVAHQQGIDLPQGLQLAGVQFDNSAINFFLLTYVI